MIGHPPTSGTRHGNGAGRGGPPKGPGRGAPASGNPAAGAGWGGPARGAHPAKSRNLPSAHAVVDLDDMSLAEREAELQARSVGWRAKIAAFEARRARLLAYREAVIWGARPRPAFIWRVSSRR